MAEIVQPSAARRLAVQFSELDADVVDSLFASVGVVFRVPQAWPMLPPRIRRVSAEALLNRMYIGDVNALLDLFDDDAFFEHQATLPVSFFPRADEEAQPFTPSSDPEPFSTTHTPEAAPVSFRSSLRPPPAVNPDPAASIFIVHGHNRGAEDAVKLLLLRATGRDAVVLHEQASGGKTIIEAIEHHGGDVAYAVVLLTGDDVGRVATAGEDANRPRARQNVILELGYFMALLGRGRVAAIVEPGVERPSDTDGVLYIPYDGPDGRWRSQLLRELRNAEVPLRDGAALL